MCVQSQSWALASDDEPIEGKDVMEFRLLYEGKLLGASRDDPRTLQKHALRRIFHPQLRQLWRSHHGLRTSAGRIGVNWPTPNWGVNDPRPAYSERTEEEWITAGWNRIAYTNARVGYGFIPLVTEEKFLRCSLDILLLRPGEPRLIMQGSDLDAKVKTILDALRMPKNLEECGGMTPQEDEEPFFCLLEDDKQVSELRVSAEDLLSLPAFRMPHPHDAYLMIHVKLKPTQQSLYSYIFE